ncbi:MAG: SlyX family protein [Alphaproteobacteria bacterium]|nr:SlyX family protein [Alphaproteobacteria bacterium]
MTEHDLEERLIDIETAIANQDRIIEDLNQVVIAQGKIIDKLEKQNKYLLDMVNQETVKPLSEETPPPHY